MAKGKLSEYSAKRSFGATPEPAPAPAAARAGPLLFVVQQHSARRMHYDFRLECDGVLKSWAVPKGPSLDPAEKRLAVPTEDHPFDYASFEGVIPPGQYGAGEVIVWDCGVYSPDEDKPWVDDRAEAERQVREGLEKGKLSLLLRGEKVKGSFALVRLPCGDGCEQVAIVDLGRGAIAFPEALAHVPVSLPCRADDRLAFREDSRLLELTRPQGETVVTDYLLWDIERRAFNPLAQYRRSTARFCGVGEEESAENAEKEKRD